MSTGKVAFADVVGYIQTSETLTHWKDYGGSGELIVLVHGLGATVANWDAIGPRLAELGRTVALDLPGFGLSPPSRNWELETHAAAIRGFISEFGTSGTLIGNSMGALLSEMVASTHPEMVDNLVLISPATPPLIPDPRIHWPNAGRLLIQAMPLIGPMVTRRLRKGKTPQQLVDMSLELVTHRRSHVPIDMVDSFVALARTRMRLPWAAISMPKTGNSIARHLARRSRFVAMIRRIKAPTLVVQGVEDRIVSPTWVEWLCGLRPDWELLQMDDTGHAPQIETPVRLLSLITPWLSERLEREDTA